MTVPPQSRPAAVRRRPAGSPIAPLFAALSTALARPPEPAFLSALLAPEFLDGAAEFWGAEADRHFRACAARGAPGALASELGPEFTRLFLVPGPQGLTPYESVFREPRPGEARLLGPAAREVQQWYRLAALDIAPEFRDLPDHLALELAFVTALCRVEEDFTKLCQPAKARRAREIRRDFLGTHLLAWVPGWAAALRERSAHPYFLALAAALEPVCRWELARLE
jgi:TorA maturation chaperone TorD